MAYRSLSILPAIYRTWASLRFDDHRGLAPRSLVLGPAGLAGVLTRPETSGGGKDREELHVSVPAEAYRRRLEWRATGWRHGAGAGGS
mgnify:CR=1 FL=1